MFECDDQRKLFWVWLACSLMEPIPLRSGTLLRSFAGVPPGDWELECLNVLNLYNAAHHLQMVPPSVLTWSGSVEGSIRMIPRCYIKAVGVTVALSDTDPAQAQMKGDRQKESQLHHTGHVCMSVSIIHMFPCLSVSSLI